MNYKLEKFWNYREVKEWGRMIDMNYKLEKFWNERLAGRTGSWSFNEL